MPYSICLFGDSIAKGVTFDSSLQKYILLKNSFSHLLQKDGEFQISNYSKFGCTVGKGFEIVTQKKEKLQAFQYTALEFGGNDCDFDWQDISDRGEGEYTPKTPLSAFRRIYGKIIDAVREAGSNPILLSLPPIDAQRYFAWISKGKSAENILKWIGDVEHIYRWHEMYNLVVFELSREKNVPLINITDTFLEERNYHSFICDDGIHLNESGHRLVYQVLSYYIRRHEPVISLAV